MLQQEGDLYDAPDDEYYKSTPTETLEKMLALGKPLPRKQMNCCDDIIMCKLINYEKPWQAPHGTITESWDALAKKLMTDMVPPFDDK